MRSKLQHFSKDESGAAAIEVGLIAAGICVALITLAGQIDADMRVVLEHLGDLLRSLSLNALS
jgi:pilus assembly protein Flp/PilA